MNFIKKIFKAYVDVPLILRIAVGLVIGALLGLFVSQATFMSIFGQVFVGALKGIAPILVFVLIISALSTAGKGLGSRFKTVIILYMASTFIASFIAVCASFMFQLEIPLADVGASEETPPDGLGQVFGVILNNMVQNPVAALMNGNYVGILTWAVIIGLAMRFVAADNTKQVLSDVSNGVSKVVGWIIQFAPFGIMGIVFTTVGENGLDIFVNYGQLLLLLVSCMLIVSLVVNPFIIFLCLKRNPYPLVLRCIKDSGISAFFTRSSAANIPVNMKLCDSLGLDEEFYSVSVPLGATINMDGAAITIAIMSLAAAFSTGTYVPFGMAILLSIVATLGACGASGVASGSLLLIPMACSLLGVSADVAMQFVAIGMVISVVQDSLETALNSSGDVMFAATAEYMEWKKQGKAEDISKSIKGQLKK